MIYCFDLDDTICYPNHDAETTHEKYALATPNSEVIGTINKLHSTGHKIIIYTARRMLTHSGDMDKILEDVGDITARWLGQHNVLYDEVIFGKPYADVYIDDKALNVDDINTLLN